MQSQKPKQPKKQQEKLRKLKQRVTGSSKGSIVTDMFLLAKELGCLADIIGREYELIFDNNGKVVGFRQKPMAIPTFIGFMDELDKYKKAEEKASKQGKGRRKR